MIVLDAGALIGLEKRRRDVIAIVEDAVDERESIRVPTTVLAQVWRNSPRQHAMTRLLAAGGVGLVELDRKHALAVGALLAESGTSDVVDAHVVVCARLLRADVVVTSDPDDLRSLDPALRLIEV